MKILKMLGPRLFPWAERLLWVDAKLRLGATDPLAYFERTTARHDVCAAFVGLPFHSNAYGPEAASRTAPSFAAHADNLVRALSSRPTLTDNVAALEAQAARYLDARGDAALAPGLIDSAHIARDLASPRCRAFNEALGCAWFEEIRCHSDRDQLSFPYALGALGLAAAAPARPAEDPVFVGRRGEPPLALVVPPGRPRRGEGPAFHWYYTHALAVGKCLACVKHRRDALAGDLLAVARAPS